MNVALSDTKLPPAVQLRRLRPILALGAPLIAFCLIPNAVSLATVAMLGRLGNTAIAGVGAGSVLYTAVCALLWGVDTGVQAIVSRATGAGHAGRIGEILAAAYVGTIPLAAVMAALIWTFGGRLVGLILPDPASAAAGGDWLAAAAPSVLFLALTLPINAAWIACGRPAIATAVMALSAPTQVVVTFLLVLGAGPVRGFGAPGAALAMSAVMLAQAFVQFGLALRYIPGFLRSGPGQGVLSEIARIAWPISAQQSLLQVGLIAAFAIVAQLGATAAAIVNVLLSLTSVPVQIETGLGAAAATLVGQALGRGDAAGARGWGWRTMAVALVLTAPMGLALVVAPAPLLGLFLHDPATLTAAVLPARIAGLGTILGAIPLVLGYSFRGAGATKIAAAIPFVSLWLLQLPVSAWIGLRLHLGLPAIVWVQTGITIVDGVLLAAVWFSSLWTRVWIGAAGGFFEDFDARRGADT
jgi:putative MATE family efflux protein